MSNGRRWRSTKGRVCKWFGDVADVVDIRNTVEEATNNLKMLPTLLMVALGSIVGSCDKGKRVVTRERESRTIAEVGAGRESRGFFNNWDDRFIWDGGFGVLF